MRLRITGGSARGRYLESGHGRSTRPTPAGVREALASMVQRELAGARVLDLFAGFGSVGLELLSRGAESALFVESSGRAVGSLERNLEALGFAERGQVWQSSVAGALPKLATEGRRFDIVFADPPYEVGLAVAVVGQVAEAGVLDGGVLIVQHSRREELPEQAGRLARYRERRSGETVLSFYREGRTP